MSMCRTTPSPCHECASPGGAHCWPKPRCADVQHHLSGLTVADMRASLALATSLIAALMSLTPPAAASDAPAPAAAAECTITGTPGRDELRGTPGNDVICGLGGRDRIDGLGGDDILRGGPGADRLMGGAGDDVLLGGPGADSGSGGKGDDACTSDRGLTDCVVDQEAPVMFEVRVPRDAMPGQSLLITWASTDMLDTVGWVRVGGRNGWEPWCFGSEATRRAVGGSQTRFSVSCSVPSVIPNGEYTAFIGVVDALDNRSEVEVPFQIVGGSDDISAPALVVAPLLTEVSPGETFTVRWELADVSGVSYTELWVYTPERSLVGYDQRPGSVTTAATLVAGDRQRGVWEQKFTLSPQASVNDYFVTLSVRDSVGNRDVLVIGNLPVRNKP